MSDTSHMPADDPRRHGLSSAVQQMEDWGVPTTEDTILRIGHVVDELGEARKRTNLIGPKEWDQLWTRHIIDSFQLTQHMPPAARIVDFGSGGGFPALILACVKNGEGAVTAIESVGKKCAFMSTAAKAAGVPLTVINDRIEKTVPFPVDFITARAFAPMPKLLEYAAPWFKKDTVGLFHKGERWQEELTAARKTWTFASEAIPSRSPGGSGVIVRLSELARVS